MASTHDTAAVRPHIFIQTNSKQSIGAIVSGYSMQRNSAHAAEFDVTVMQQEDYPFFARREGQSYMRHGVKPVWHENDLVSEAQLKEAMAKNFIRHDSFEVMQQVPALRPVQAAA